jgi:hypothetical protein
VPADARPDAVAPKVTSRTPAPGADGVDVHANVVVGFSEPIHPATLTAATVRLHLGATAVPATLTMAPGATGVTLDPAADLAPGTTYTATVGGVVDGGGNALAAPVTWTFTTAAAGGHPDPGPRPGPGPGPGPGDPPAGPGTSPVCTAYPALRRTLARNLAAARRDRAKARTPKARAAAARRIARITRQQKRASARLGPACGARVAFCLRYPDTRATLARRVADARRAVTRARTASARAAAVKRRTAATKAQRQATARFRTACRPAAA